MNGLKLTGLDGFIETNRSESRTREGMDQLVCKFTGPFSKKETIIPTYGAAHGTYSMMTFRNVSQSEIGAGLCEVSLTYQGKMLLPSGGSFASIPIVTEVSQEKEFQFTRKVSFPVGSSQNIIVRDVTPLGAGSSGVSSIQYFKVGTSGYSRRYLTNSVTIKYQATPRPSSPKFQSIANDKCQITNQYDSWSGSVDGVLTTNPNFMDPSILIPQFSAQLLLVDFKLDGYFNWYQCEETWEIRFINS